MEGETNDARTLLRKIQTPIQRRISKCGLFGMIIGLLILIVGIILLFVMLYSPEKLYGTEIKKCVFMIEHLNNTHVKNYIDHRLKSIIIKVNEQKLNDTKYYTDELKPYVEKMKNEKLEIYISLEPQYVGEINKKFGEIMWDGIVIDNTYVKDDIKIIRQIFNHVNEYKVKRNTLFKSIFMTEFGAIIDRYYFDKGLYVTHLKDQNTISKMFNIELKKGDGLIGIYSHEYENDLNKVFEVANYIENTHMANDHFFGYVIIFDN